MHVGTVGIQSHSTARLRYYGQLHGEAIKNFSETMTALREFINLSAAVPALHLKTTIERHKEDLLPWFYMMSETTDELKAMLSEEKRVKLRDMMSPHVRLEHDEGAG